jgi:hypothetical protein
MAHFNLGAPVSGDAHSELTAAPVIVEAVEARPSPPPPAVPSSLTTSPPSAVQYRAEPISDAHALPPSHPSTADNSGGTRPVTSTIDPNVPSALSGPTALPTNPSTHPAEQRAAIQREKPEVVAREVEKTKGEEREIKGEPVGGTVVKGVEDDRLFAMLRRFDNVSCQLDRSKLTRRTSRTYSTPRPSSLRPSPTCASPSSPTSLRTRT